MATLSSSSSTSYSSENIFETDIQAVGDSTQDIGNFALFDNRQKLTRSLFVEQILEVSFSKEGHRYYRVQWEPTWESEEELLSACKNILRTYWDNHIQFNIILDKDVYPEDVTSDERRYTKGDGISTDIDINTETTHNIDSSLPSQVDDIFPLLEDSKKTNCGNETKVNDIPEQYKMVGFAKSVRENFGKELISENKFDFVEHYLAEKLHVKSQPAVKKKTCADNMIKRYVSYKNGTRVSCDICWQSFADPKSLMRHKVVRHDKFSPHQCSICCKMFIKPGDVRRHMTSHSPTRAHYCCYCEKTYKTKNHLHRHMKKKHNFNTTDDVLEQMLATDPDPTDINQTVINVAQEHPDSLLSAATLHSEFSNPGDALNPVTLTANTVLFHHPSSLLSDPHVVLHQSAENFINPSADAIQMCLIDRGFF